MLVESPGQVRRFSEIPRGGAFRCELLGQILLAVKTWSANGDSSAIVAPGHPQLNDLPGICDPALFGERPLLHLPDLRLLPALHKSAYAFSAPAVKPGTLLLGGTRTYLAVAQRVGPLRYVDMASGEIVDTVAEPLMCSKWSLTQIVLGRPVGIYVFGADDWAPARDFR